MATNAFSDTISGIGRSCRTVALALIAGVSRKTGFHGLETRVAALPLREQAILTGATLALILGLSLFAAQFGLVGLAFYLLAIVLIVG